MIGGFNRMKYNYNIEVLSYLIASFKNIVEQMGFSANSVNFFKAQAENIISISQIEYDDVLLVYKALGIDRDIQRISEDITMKRLNTFCEVMNTCLQYNDKNNLSLYLYQASQENKYDSSTIDLFYDIFGVNKFTVKAPTKSSGQVFGEFRTGNTAPNLKMQHNKIMLGNKYGNCELVFSSSNGCSGTTYRRYDIVKGLDTNFKNLSKTEWNNIRNDRFLINNSDGQDIKFTAQDLVSYLKLLASKHVAVGN